MNEFMTAILSMYVAQSYFNKEMAKQSGKPKKPARPKKTEKVMSVDKQIDEAVRLGVLTEEEANELRGV